MNPNPVAAKSSVYNVAVVTPLEDAPRLSHKLCNNVYLKREDLQPIKSFKIRGAYNKISSLNQQEKSAGVIAASAGNHAQGVAYSANKMGISSLIVMPQTTPEIKVEAVKSFGGETVLFGDNYSEAAEYCKKLTKETGRTFVHPFDDEKTIEGQATLAQEILNQLPQTDYIFVPIGGGGLIAGVAKLVKSIRPEIKIIGVEPTDSNAMQASVMAGEIIELDEVGIFADGVAVKKVGEHTFEYVKKYVDEIVTVSTDQICAAIKYIYQENRSVVEPAGALAVAGMVKMVHEKQLSGLNLVAINSGANMTFERLQFIAERTLLGSEKEAIYAIKLPEKKGALEKLCSGVIKDHAISEFNYRLYRRDEANIFVGVLFSGREDKVKFEKNLSKNDYKFEDLSENDLAKLHIRHMIGGRADETPRERLVSFTFPEKPGALAYFLAQLSGQFNISLFHYRNLGGDAARVLMGFEVTASKDKEFESFLQQQGYSYVEETENSAYQKFLRPIKHN
jgi:threonine dehydratase